jgi:hypothetical protein
MPKIYYRGEIYTRHLPSPAERLDAGFPANMPSRGVTVEAVIEHIVSGTLDSPFVSVTLCSSIALRYATDNGVLWAFQFPTEIQILNPVSVINAWLVENPIGDREFISRAKEALVMATEDQELLVVGWLPPLCIDHERTIYLKAQPTH